MPIGGLADLSGIHAGMTAMGEMSNHDLINHVRPPSSGSRLQRFISAMMMLGMIGLLLITGKWLLAEVYHLQARAFMDSWASNHTIPDGEWEIARLALTKSIRLQPNQGAYHEEMSELLFQGSFKPSIDPVESAKLQKQALETIRIAVHLRPSWPYAWAQLALFKYQLSGLDNEVTLALEKAIVQGPWEPSVQVIVAEISLSSWESLNHDLREKILDHIAHAKQPEANKVLSIAKKHNMAGVICDMLKSKPNWVKLCLKVS